MYTAFSLSSTPSSVVHIFGSVDSTSPIESVEIELGLL